MISFSHTHNSQMVKESENWTGTLTTTLSGPNVNGSCNGTLKFTINVDDTIQGSMVSSSTANVFASADSGNASAPTINTNITGNYDESSNKVSLKLQTPEIDENLSATSPSGSGAGKAQIIPNQVDLEAGALGASSFSSVISPLLGTVTDNFTSPDGSTYTTTQSTPRAQLPLNWDVPPIDRIPGGIYTDVKTYGSLTVTTVLTINPDCSPPTTWHPGDIGVEDGANFVVYANSINQGGDRNWRNNNPGNIEAGAFADGQGAIGADGRFAIFPDPQTGMNALIALLQTQRYQALSLDDAIATWAPPNENPTAAYQQYVQNATGLDGDTPMDTLTPNQFAAVGNAIDHFEGGHAGTTYTRGDPHNPAWVMCVFKSF